MRNLGWVARTLPSRLLRSSNWVSWLLPCAYGPRRVASCQSIAQPTSCTQYFLLLPVTSYGSGKVLFDGKIQRDLIVDSDGFAILLSGLKPLELEQGGDGGGI